MGQWHFHQDNAPVHNSILVTDYLTKMGINTVPHHPYSRDLAPCVFWHCSQRRLLRRGLEFHVRTINKSAHMKKVWKLIVYTSYIYKWDLALKNHQGLVCHKQNKTISSEKTSCFICFQNKYKYFTDKTWHHFEISINILLLIYNKKWDCLHNVKNKWFNFSCIGGACGITTRGLDYLSSNPGWGYSHFT